MLALLKDIKFEKKIWLNFATLEWRVCNAIENLGNPISLLCMHKKSAGEGINFFLFHIEKK